jgi:hypothetical protein
MFIVAVESIGDWQKRGWPWRWNMLYTLISNGMRKEVKSIWWDQGGECWIDLSANGPLGPWLASGSGTPSPLEGWWAPVAQQYKREWGPRAQTARFAAATVAPTPQTLTVPEGRAEAMGSLTDVSTGPCRRPYSDRRCPCADFTREPVMAALRGSSKYVLHRGRTHLIYS